MSENYYDKRTDFPPLIATTDAPTEPINWGAVDWKKVKRTLIYEQAPPMYMSKRMAEIYQKLQDGEE